LKESHALNDESCNTLLHPKQLIEGSLYPVDILTVHLRLIVGLVDRKSHHSLISTLLPLTYVAPTATEKKFLISWTRMKETLVREPGIFQWRDVSKRQNEHWAKFY